MFRVLSAVAPASRAQRGAFSRALWTGGATRPLAPLAGYAGAPMPRRQPQPQPQPQPLARPSWTRAQCTAAAPQSDSPAAPSPTSSSASSLPAPSTKREKALKKWGWALDLLGLNSEESQRNRGSEMLFASAQEQARSPGLAERFALPAPGEEGGAAFRAQHALLVLHVWAVHRRLVQEASGTEGKLMQEALFDRLWEQSVLMIRALGVQELTVNKHLKELQQVSFGAMISYDNGLQDPDDPLDALAGALYRNLYARNDDVPEDVVMGLAEYAVAQIGHVQDADWEQLIEGRIAWQGATGEAAARAGGGGGGGGGGADGAGAAAASPATVTTGEGEWRQALDERGRTYWWHTVTRETAWDDPTK